jgi:succinyl-CoA synthetase beta subunit
MAVQHPELSAVDINPLVIDGDAAIAVDSLVIVEGKAP